MSNGLDNGGSSSERGSRPRGNATSGTRLTRLLRGLSEDGGREMTLRVDGCCPPPLGKGRRRRGQGRTLYSGNRNGLNKAGGRRRNMKRSRD